MLDFAGAQVVVTGGFGALGSAVVGVLSAAGAVCHIPGRRIREADASAYAGNPNIRLVEGVDITDETAVDQFYRSVPKLWASVHLVGGFAAAPFGETSVAQFDAQYRINARSCFLCMQAAVAGIRGRGAGGGRIVNVAARPALEPRTGAGMVAYAAAKAAVAAMTQALAEELAGEAIWINAVVPSIIDTPVNRAAMPQADFTRWVAPAAIAATIAFLASPQNGATRGALIPVFGAS
jgi:NAD(P)-dependent dehydrogenase (short-subunit alcohol dehydrogenase family)